MKKVLLVLLLGFAFCDLVYLESVDVVVNVDKVTHVRRIESSGLQYLSFYYIDGGREEYINTKYNTSANITKALRQLGEYNIKRLNI